MIGLGLLRRLAEAAARAAVERKLGDYRVEVASPDEARPQRARPGLRVAVIGGGLAGVTAAETLARRGLHVTLLEKSLRMGGKIGGDTARDPEGHEVPIDHGFHAFFRHYHNLAGFLARCGVPPLIPIDDYEIVAAGGEVARFGEIERTPLLNVVSLGARGFFRLSEVSPTRTRTRMHELLSYDPERTFRDLDDKSFATFADEARLPPKLRRIFATFGRAFFADERRLSAAELIRAFHFYFLSHDRGLVYDYPSGPAAETVVGPIERRLTELGVEIALGREVDRIHLEAGEGGVSIGPDRFDYVVVATHAMAAKAIAEASPTLAAACPAALRALRSLERGDRYAVLRVWLDRDPCSRHAVFVSTDRVRLLDAVASYHRITEVDRAWASRTGGAALELHCYAVPDDVVDGEIEPAMIRELARFFPDAEGARVLGTHLALRDDFTARHVGMARLRPGSRTEDPRIVLAGDWVTLPVPALLMEGACTSGLFAANALLESEGLSLEPIYSVPLRGIFADKG